MVEGAALEMRCTARYRGFESLALRHFFCKKMANEDISLLFTVRSTTSLKKQSFFFTSSPNSRSLAFCSFFFMPGTLMRKNSARACDFLEGCLPLLAVNGSASQARGTCRCSRRIPRSLSRRSFLRRRIRHFFCPPFNLAEKIILAIICKTRWLKGCYNISASV